MRLSEVLGELECGGSITRTSYSGYIRIVPDPRCDSRILFFSLIDVDPMPFVFYAEDILADDWEVYRN